MLGRVAQKVSQNLSPIRQKTEGDVTIVVIQPNNDTEMIFRRVHKRAPDGRIVGCEETPYSRREYENLFGELSI